MIPDKGSRITFQSEKIARSLILDLSECIDCDACRVECVVEAIFHEDDVPDQWQEFIQLNAEMAAKSPSITEKKQPRRRTS